MALIKCHECGSNVSTEALVCPSCGAPVKAPKDLGYTSRELEAGLKEPVVLKKAILVLVVIGLVVWWLFSSLGNRGTSGAPAASPRQPPDTCQADDILCLGNKGLPDANAYCPAAIERSARYDVKWTDGWADLKFDKFDWKDEAKGVIAYFGDRAEFQNGFGAYTPVIYECDLAPDNRTVLAVRVEPGRVPE